MVVVYMFHHEQNDSMLFSQYFLYFIFTTSTIYKLIILVCKMHKNSNYSNKVLLKCTFPYCDALHFVVKSNEMISPLVKSRSKSKYLTNSQQPLLSCSARFREIFLQFFLSDFHSMPIMLSICHYHYYTQKSN